MPQFREYPVVSNAIANDAVLMERMGDGTVYIEFDNLANSVATYIDIANSPAIQNTVQHIFDTANSVLDTANAVLNYAQTNTVVFINGVFANASAQANAIIANASANYGNATAFINGVLAQANAAAEAAQTAANTAIDSINYAVANALATANGAIIATYVAQASTYADQANGFAQAAELSALIAASNAALAYSASASAAFAASNASYSEAGAATYSINAAQSAVNAELYASGASIYSSQAGSYATNAAQSAFTTQSLVNLANTSASNASVSASQAAAASNSANAASAAAVIQYTLAAAAAANASAYSASAQASSNIAVAAASDANSSQAAAASFLGLAIQAKNDASNSAATALVYENQALNASTNANSSASTASTQAGLATSAAFNSQSYANSSGQYAQYSSAYADKSSGYATIASASALNANTGAASAQAYSVTSLNAANSAAGSAASALTSSVQAAQYANSIQSQYVQLAETVATNNAATTTAIAGLSSQVNASNAAILTLQQTVATQNATTTSQLNILTSAVANTNANVSTLSSTVTTNQSATASQITSLNASIASISSPSTIFSNKNPYLVNNPAATPNTTTLPASYPSSYYWDRNFANAPATTNSVTNNFYTVKPYSLNLNNIQYAYYTSNSTPIITVNLSSGLNTAFNPPNLGTSSSIGLVANTVAGYPGGATSASQIYTSVAVPAGYYVVEAEVAFDKTSDSRYGAGVMIDAWPNQSVSNTAFYPQNINFATDADVSNTVANATSFSFNGLAGPSAILLNAANATTAHNLTDPKSEAYNYFEGARRYSKVVYFGDNTLVPSGQTRPTTWTIYLSGCLYDARLWYGPNNNYGNPPAWGRPPVYPSRSIVWNQLSIRPASAAEIAGYNSTASIQNLANVFVTANSATATQINTLNSQVGNNTASISTISTTVATNNATTTSQINTLNSNFNNLSANVTILANTVANSSGSSSSYSLKLDANGVVTGMQTFAGSNGISTFDVYASNFTLSDPNAPALKFKPLSFANGILYLGNTVVNGSFIINGTVVTDTIANYAVSQTAIATASSPVVYNSLTALLSVNITLTNTAEVVCQGYVYGNDGGGGGASSHNTRVQINVNPGSGNIINANMLSSNYVLANPWAVSQALFTTGSITLSPGTYNVSLWGSTANNDNLTQRFLLAQWFYK